MDSSLHSEALPCREGASDGRVLKEATMDYILDFEKLDKNSTQPKVIKSSMFKKLRNFLDDFGVRNIFEDEVLVDLSKQARDLIDGVSPGGIKKNDVMRKRIKNEMNDLKFAIDSAIEDMPRRKIRMAI